MRQNFFVTCLATLVSLSLGSDLKSYSATPTPTVIASDAPSAQEPTVLAATDKGTDAVSFREKYHSHVRDMATEPMPDFKKLVADKYMFEDLDFPHEKTYF